MLRCTRMRHAVVHAHAACLLENFESVIALLNRLENGGVHRLNLIEQLYTRANMSKVKRMCSGKMEGWGWE